MSEPRIGDGQPVPQMNIRPEEIKEQIPWKEARGVVVLVDMGPGKINQLYMSTMPLGEVTWLSKQLDSHLTCLLGPMKEGF